MTAAAEKKPAAQEPAPPATEPKEPPKLDWSKPVIVALARFERSLQIPGGLSTQTQNPTARTYKDAQSSTLVEYLAAVRMFRITFVAKGKDPKVAYVPEARVLSWEPFGG